MDVEILKAALVAEGHGLFCPIVNGQADTCSCPTGAAFERRMRAQFDAVGVVERLTAKLHRHRLLHSCLTCIFFDEQLELCKPVNLRPPARVIAFGCPAWEDDSQAVINWAKERQLQEGGTLEENLQVVVSQQFTTPLAKLPF